MNLATSAKGVFVFGSDRIICSKANASRSAILLPLAPVRRHVNARPSLHTQQQSIVRASSATYEAPSSVGGATELDALSAITVVVPDSVLMAREKDIPRKAATVSAGVLGDTLCGIVVFNSSYITVAKNGTKGT